MRAESQGLNPNDVIKEETLHKGGHELQLGVKDARPQRQEDSKVLAPYHRTLEEITKMPVLGRTKTVCPECKLIIDGIIYRDGDNVMIRKQCPEHGLFVEKYWEDYEMYTKMESSNYYGHGISNPNYPTQGENCPFDCGLCSRHHSHTALANVVVTNRCHLSCWYCFFYAKEGEPIYEPSIEQLDAMFKNLRNQKPVAANALQITGGEPTMREDIVEIVRHAKQAGFDQIQLNTTGINLGANPDLAVKLREAGVSTLYMSCDGVSKKANPKNHWEIPSILNAARKAGIGVVFVPTVIRTVNDQELGKLINFALNNIDIVRAVNFQPVSLVGRMPKGQREKQRITIPGAIKLIEEQTGGAIKKEDWFSVPYIGGISKFVESLTGNFQYDLSIHFACGAGTYLFLDENNKVIPLPRFVDVEGLLRHLTDAANRMQGKSKTMRKLIALKAIASISKFVDKEKMPKNLNFIKLLSAILINHDFGSLGKFHVKSLFLGMMHFQDEYTYDIERVEKCDIHYAMPDGEVLPFCTFNVFPEIYRDKIQRQYSISSEEWQKKHPEWSYRSDKYVRDIKKLEASPEYIKTYGQIKDFFAKSGE
ncbi:MAG: radical SAM protein [Candidatus Micrarchaeaceae archaeon]